MAQEARRRGFGVVKPAAALLVLVAILAVACSGAAARRSAVPHFDHVIVIVFENKDRSAVIGNSDAPFFNLMASHYATLTRYGGVAHPSLPNYLALVSGSTHGIRIDCTTCLVSGRNLADTLASAHLAWKAYAEGLPYAGFTGPSFRGRYAKKHMPFLYFRDVLRSRTRKQRVVPLSQFSRDLSAGNLPAFSLVVPDLCHDMHDCRVRTGDSWLRGFVTPLLSDPSLSQSVIFVVFDEPTAFLPSSTVPALALGPLVKAGSHYSAKTSHYGLLRTIEDAWNLPRLGSSAQIGPITGIWK
jgi:phosphatidylinositol-3-phosphatase